MGIAEEGLLLRIVAGAGFALFGDRVGADRIGASLSGNRLGNKSDVPQDRG
jgi:hypothetical protein